MATTYKIVHTPNPDSKYGYICEGDCYHIFNDDVDSVANNLAIPVDIHLIQTKSINDVYEEGLTDAYIEGTIVRIGHVVGNRSLEIDMIIKSTNPRIGKYSLDVKELLKVL